jgi:hypothetical protein
MADGFHIGRAVTGLLARPRPVDYRLLSAARRGVVLGHQLWLRLDGLRELGLQCLGNALMVLLAGAPQQRLIRHIPDERMLERVGGLRRRPPLGLSAVGSRAIGRQRSRRAAETSPQGVRIQLELALQGAIGHTAPLAQRRNHLVHERDKVHLVSSLLFAGPVYACASPS